jgi:hypothetical protein
MSGRALYVKLASLMLLLLALAMALGNEPWGPT